MAGRDRDDRRGRDRTRVPQWATLAFCCWRPALAAAALRPCPSQPWLTHREADRVLEARAVAGSWCPSLIHCGRIDKLSILLRRRCLGRRPFGWPRGRQALVASHDSRELGGVDGWHALCSGESPNSGGDAMSCADLNS